MAACTSGHLQTARDTGNFATSSEREALLRVGPIMRKIPSIVI